jgi:hypothetical protein
MNVFSITNAGKRLYGENHWFWAVWTGVEQTIDLTPKDERRHPPYWAWNGAEPTASGFCESKRDAKHAAWSAIKSSSPESPRAYERGWAWDFLSEKQEKEDCPRFSRCKIGKNKWLWVVYQGNSWFSDDDPLAHGIADSPEAALSDAEAACGPVSHSWNSLADTFRKKQAALKRKNKVTHSSNTAALEFVYDCDHDSVTKYRIVKKTKKRIYVESDRYSEHRKQSGTWWDYSQSTFILDREKFEKTGHTWNRSKRATFYSDPKVYYEEIRSWGHRPECFVGLGVPAGASIQEVKAAYRKMAIETHPDRGGDPKEFMQVKSWYEQAMALA